MGRVSDFFDKITDVFDELKESRQEKYQARQRAREASSDPPSRRNWSPGCDYDEPKRRTTDDFKYRNPDFQCEDRRSIRRSVDARYHNPDQYHEGQSSSGSEGVISHNPDRQRRDRKYRQLEEDKNYRQSNPELGRMKSLRRALSVGKRGDRGGNTRSEGNLPRDVHIRTRDHKRGRDISPRKSEPLLPLARSKNRQEESRPRDNNKSPSRSRTQRRQNQAGDVPPVPPIPQKLVEEARNNAQLPYRRKNPAETSRPTPSRNLQVELYEEMQREAARKKLHKPVVDLGKVNKGRNENIRQAAEIDNRCSEEESRRVAEKPALAASNKRQKELDEVRRREKDNAEKRRVDKLEREVARLSELARQRDYIERDIQIAAAREAALEQEILRQQEAIRQEEAARQREKAEKRRKAEEAERKANFDRTIEAERVRKEEEKKANATKMLQEDLARQESVKRDNEAARLRAFSPNGGAGSNQPQRRPILAHQAESGRYAPRDTQPERQDTRPSPHRQALPPPRVAPLTVENLQTFQDDSMGGRHDPASELGRLGDNTRTFIHGFEVATEDQSDEEGNVRT